MYICIYVLIANKQHICLLFIFVSLTNPHDPVFQPESPSPPGGHHLLQSPEGNPLHCREGSTSERWFKLGVFHSDNEQFCWSILTQHSWNHVYLYVYMYKIAYAHVWVKTDGHVPLELDGFIVKLIGMSWPVAPKWPLGGVRDRQQWTVWCPILREIGGHHTPSGVIQQNFARVILCHLCEKRWGREWST